MKYIELKLSRFTLLLTEREILSALSDELVDTGRKRTKGRKRARDLARRSERKVEEWLEAKHRRIL